MRDEKTKIEEQARNDDNEFNIRKNFLDNAVAAIQTATMSQYNIVICTDQAHDDFQDLQGRILPMDLLDVTIAPGKTVNFEVYVFDTGKYLRHGKYERDHWWWWGESKKFFDPAAMHVHFENAQPKLNADEVKKQLDDAAAKKKAADDATAAAKAAQDKQNAANAGAVATNAAGQAAAQQAQANGTAPPAIAPFPAQQQAPGAGAGGLPGAGPAPADPYGAQQGYSAQSTDPYGAQQGYGAQLPDPYSAQSSSPTGGYGGQSAPPGPAPGFMSRK